MVDVVVSMDHADVGAPLSHGTVRPLPSDVDELGLGYSPQFIPPCDFELISEADESRKDEVTTSETQHTSIPSGLDFAIREAHFENGVVLDIKQPWETNVFASIFGSDQGFVFPKVTRPEGFYDVPATCSSANASGHPTNVISRATYFESCISFHMHKTKLCSEEVQLDLIYQRWEAALMHAPSASSVGRFMFGKDRDERLSIVAETLGGRKLATLRKRIGQLRKFFEWGLRERDGCEGDELFPLTISDLRGYFQHMKKIGCPLSRYEGWLQCANFLFHVLGVGREPGYENDAYVRGIIRGAQASKPRRKQSRCFLVDEIKDLENFIHDEKRASVDRYAMGCVLFAIYSRARFADLVDVEEYIVDIVKNQSGWRGYLELRSASHKMRAVGDGLGHSLPLIAPIHGLNDAPWGIEFIKVSKLVNLDMEKRGRGPLLPAPDKLGNWTDRCISTREIGAWFRTVLASLGHVGLKDLTPHGAKATTLAQMAKFGIPPHDRLVLGHHKAREGSSLDVYARDTQSHPLRQLERMLASIRSGVFHPDRTRSGMMEDVIGETGDAKHVFEAPTSLQRRDQRPENVEMETEVTSDKFEVDGNSSRSEGGDLKGQKANEDEESNHDGDLQDVLSDNDSSDEFSSTSSSSGDSILEDAKIVADHPVIWKPNCEIYQHRRSKTLHLLPMGDDKGTFLCGRQLGEEFVAFNSTIVTEFWKCKQCQAGRSVRGVEASAAIMDQAFKRRRC